MLAPNHRDKALHQYSAHSRRPGTHFSLWRTNKFQILFWCRNGSNDCWAL